MYVLNTLVPLLAIVVLGAVLRQTGFAPASMFRETNRLLYWVALPALLFYQTAEATLKGDSARRVFIVLLVGLFGCLLLGYLVARMLRLPPSEAGAFVQGTYRGNLAYVGLPVVLLALAAPNGQAAPEINALAVLSVAFLIPIYNLTSVVVLLAGRREGADTAHTVRKMLVAMITNPLVLSCGAGLLFAVFGWKLPPMVRQTCATLGQMSTALALLGIGAALTFASVRHRIGAASASSLIKVAASPLIGYLVARWMGLSPAELRVAMIYLACPTAAASYVMAQQLGADDKLAGSIIVVSTLLAVPALAVSLIIT
jgi:predicted permease